MHCFFSSMYVHFSFPIASVHHFILEMLIQDLVTQSTDALHSRLFIHTKNQKKVRRSTKQIHCTCDLLLECPTMSILLRAMAIVLGARTIAKDTSLTLGLEDEEEGENSLDSKDS